MTWPAESVTGGLTLLMMKKKPSVRTTEGTFRKNRVLEMSFDYFVDVQIMPICFRLWQCQNLSLHLKLPFFFR